MCVRTFLEKKISEDNLISQFVLLTQSEWKLGLLVCEIILSFIPKFSSDHC